VPSDNIDDSKVIKDVHFHFEISSVMEHAPIDSCLPILNEIHVSSASTIDIVDAFGDTSTPTPDETYIHEENQESQETEIESIITTPSMSSSSESLEFLAMLYQVSSAISSFNRCLEFSLEFF